MFFLRISVTGRKTAGINLGRIILEYKGGLLNLMFCFNRVAPNTSFSFPLFLLNVLVKVYVNEDFNNKDLAILVFENVQLPKQDIALFCTQNSLEKLKKIVDEKVDWTKFNQFNVSLNK